MHLKENEKIIQCIEIIKLVREFPFILLLPSPPVLLIWTIISVISNPKDITSQTICGGITLWATVADGYVLYTSRREIKEYLAYKRSQRR